MKNLSEYTSEELKEYYTEKNALDRMEEEMLEKVTEREEEYYGDEDLDDEEE